MCMYLLQFHLIQGACHSKISPPPPKTGPGDQFWQQKWSPRTGFDCQNWSYPAKNGPPKCFKYRKIKLWASFFWTVDGLTTVYFINNDSEVDLAVNASTAIRLVTIKI